MLTRFFVPLFAVACAGGIKDGVTDAEPETTPPQRTVRLGRHRATGGPRG